MQKIIFIISFFLSLISADECIHYQNTVISGTLYRKTFPGPPNYESIESGDIAETYYLLKLSRPQCVSGGKGGDVLEENYTSVNNIQLVLDDSATYASLRPFIGKQIQCKGKLFSAISGHHHTKVLLSEISCH